ncbi:MAG: RluA family pseudouridine synthase [Oscillospiraceae bacterium]|nr:RluA family pseudouridine synthase [Oscillospiraceae bacterium]
MNYHIVTAEEGGERIDALLSRFVPSRSAAARLLEQGAVLCNGRAVRKNYRPAPGDELRWELPGTEETELLPQNIPLDIVYEDGDVIVVNKPKGMVVHPAAGHPDGTLVNALLYHCGESLSGIGGERRPGIVHRLDKDTSGLIIAAKNDFAHLSLTAQLSDRSLSRVYEAVAQGNFREDRGTVNAPIGRHPVDRKRMAVTDRNSREAITDWEVMERYGRYTRVRCILRTGRTHQIRVHMAYIHHPLLGDTVYGGAADKGLDTQCLHARKLKFLHPRTGEEVALECPLPPYFTEVLRRLGPVCGERE